MKRIEAVLFDLDGTLLRYRRSPGEVLHGSFERVGVEQLFHVEDYYARFDEFAERCDSMDELRSECFASLAAENGYSADIGREVATAFTDERDQANVELYPRVPDVLETLSRNYTIGIVTNGARDAQQQKIEAVDLGRWTDTIVIAGQGIPPKPAIDPFRDALGDLGVTPDAAVHVGNSLEADVGGATAAGLDTVWISDEDVTHEYTPTYQLESVSRLIPPPWEPE